MLPGSEISAFYKDKCVFITGATGFMGKALIEKLLRSCPDIKRIYILVRAKANIDAGNRLRELIQSELFNNYIRQTPYEQLAKLVAVQGDVTQPNLGLSNADTEVLAENVSVVFHCAATVRFDEPLKNAAEMNIGGVQKMIELCKKMRRLETLVHVSTAYVNCIHTELNEFIYPMNFKEENIKLSNDSCNNMTESKTERSFLNGYPNTYTYTKALAEHIFLRESLAFPVSIVRPTIVTGTWKEPVPGWTDSLNGPAGFIAGYSAGIIRTLYFKRSINADFIPLEYPINLMISLPWHTVLHRSEKLSVYTIGTSGCNPITSGQFKNYIEEAFLENPSSKCVWPPRLAVYESRSLHRLSVIYRHLFPAYAIDLAARLTGRKPHMVRLQRKVSKMSECLEFFMTNNWRSRCDNTMALFERLNESDRVLFNFDPRNIDWRNYMLTYSLGIKSSSSKKMIEMSGMQNNDFEELSCSSTVLQQLALQ